MLDATGSSEHQFLVFRTRGLLLYFWLVRRSIFYPPNKNKTAAQDGYTYHARPHVFEILSKADMVMMRVHPRSGGYVN